MKKKFLSSAFILITFGLLLTWVILFVVDSNNKNPVLDLKYALTEGNTYSVSLGAKNTETEIIIPSEYQNKPVTEITARGFQSGTDIITVVIPDSIVKIGEYAFSDCTKLANVTFNNGLAEIGNGAFFGCSRLIKAEIPDSVTSIGMQAFSKCISLKELKIGTGIKTLSYQTFYGCSALTILDTAKVENIGGEAFSGCNSLFYINMGIDVKSIGTNAFASCKILATINYNGTSADWSAIEKDLAWNADTGNYTVKCTDIDVNK